MRKLTLYTILMLVVNAAFAQKLDDRWDKMLDKAENYQNYKVVKKTDLESTWKAIEDTMIKYRLELAKERALITGQEDQIEKLEKQVVEHKEKYQKADLEKDSISFIGLPINKYTYATVLWSMVAILVAACAVIFFLFNNSNRVTQQKIREYEDLFSSFEEFKKNTIEKERKLKREIQTQMNTIEELKRPSRV